MQSRNSSTLDMHRKALSELKHVILDFDLKDI